MEQGLAGRLAEPFLLAVLSRGPMHGYGLFQELETAFGPDSIAKARVYQILRRLEAEGLVTPTGDDDIDGSEGRSKRKLYELTPQGQGTLAEIGTQTPTFFRVLSMLFPNMEAAVVAEGAANGQVHGAGGDPVTAATAADLPRDGARTQVACPGCTDLRVRMERTLPHDELVIRVARNPAVATAEDDGSTAASANAARPHLEACVVGLALRRLAASLLP